MSVQPLDDLFAGHAGPWTEEEWLALPETMGRVELLDGALLVSPNPANPHQRLVRHLGHALDQAAPADLEVIEGINVRLARGRLLIPDIAVLAPPGLDATIVDATAVRLVVEVTSPSNAWSDRLVKPDAYARAGIPHYLRIDFERWPDDLGASCCALGPTGIYTQTARADEGGRIVVDEPFHVELDLPALARSTRYPRDR